MRVQGATAARPAIRPAPPAFVGEAVSGTHIGRYEVVSELGRGGMGIVYKAKDPRLERLVAIKVLPSEWSLERTARDRFLREAQAASAIDHQNICTIYDIDSTSDEQLFIVMAHYEGQTLRQRLEGGALTNREIVDITIQIANALEAAHCHGIVHRDIKPGNIFLCRTGVVKVLDFGLARCFSAAADTELWLDGSDVPGRPLGTANYMAPERILEMPVDPRSDLFSLGVVMYEMATNRRPFAGASPAETVMNVLDNDPEPLTWISPERPRGLAKVVTRALAKSPKDRFQSAADLRTALYPQRRQHRSQGRDGGLNDAGGSYESEWSGVDALRYVPR
jgi:serine/threonine protein kinase